ncbi:DUF2778 domain-containing protein [Roseibium sp. M-1]
MLQKKQKVGRAENASRRKNDRTLYAALAGATLILSGLAATAVFLGTSISSTHLTAAKAVPDQLTLVQVPPVAASLGLAPVEAVPPRAMIATAAAKASQPDQSAPSLTAEAEANALKAAREAEAQKAAKVALAAKLARQQLARTLLAQQAISSRGTVLAQDEPEPAIEPTIVVAALQAVGATAAAETDVVARQQEIVVASIDPAVPVKPGAIMPRIPDLKPEPPRRSAPASAEHTKDKPKNKSKDDEASPVLAYATPGTPEDDENGVFGGIGKLFGGGKAGMPGPGSKVAIYDISSATVHMPDGSKLEAHSGIGHRMDNPKYAYVKMLGPTPPNVYTLRMRERRFHGVEAIRMLPHDVPAMKGRDGMLTHTRLLRNSIGSHGCVAFKDYNKFLNAFKAGKVKTMIVVPSMRHVPTYMAKLERGAGA